VVGEVIVAVGLWTRAGGRGGGAVVSARVAGWCTTGAAWCRSQVWSRVNENVGGCEAREECCGVNWRYRRSGSDISTLRGELADLALPRHTRSS